MIGGLTGIMVGTPVIDHHVTDSYFVYFVVAHPHYVLFAGSAFGLCPRREVTPCPLTGSASWCSTSTRRSPRGRDCGRRLPPQRAPAIGNATAHPAGLTVAALPDPAARLGVT
ncbi:hypothetical protein [Streptomyces incarnatus]|uniref:hypothetical protein n=1 Tax=Streptomyces incarnatus TaxID=665007 RepID=UPI001AD805C8|nr:hypothetical protein [Streptomyces incarnatus]